MHIYLNAVTLIVKKAFQTSSHRAISTTLSNYSAMKSNRHAGKVAIVTASTEGIGLEIARKLAEDGASVVISSRKKEKVDSAVEELKLQGLDAIGTVCHVGKKEDRQALIDYTLKEKGGIDYFIANAGMNPTVSFILDTEEAAWDKIFEINVKSAFLMTKEIVPHISKRGGGSVVYVSSVAGFKAIGPLSAYSVSKTALLGLTRAVAEQCAPMGIRVNCIAPGIIRTKFSRMLFAHPEAEKKINEDTLLGRIGEASECGGVVSFLCSDDASYITGENLPVTGGMFSRL